MPASEATRSAWSVGRFRRSAGNDPERDPDDRREQDREERQLGRRGDELPEVVRDRLVREGRLPEIAVDEVLQVDQVAHGQRLVEAVVLLEGLDRLGIRGRLLAEVRRRRVARDELREHERDERDPEHEQHEGAQPAEDEAQEARRGAEPAAPRGGSRLRHGRDRHRDDASRRLGSATVPSGSHDELPPVEIVPGYSSRMADWGGMTVAFEKAHAGQDASGMVKGLPDDRCQAPHWGYLFSGRMTVDYGDRQETIEGGQAYYIAPGHLITFADRLRGARVHADGRARADDGGGPPELRRRRDARLELGRELGRTEPRRRPRCPGREPRSSADVFDDPDEFVEAVALAAGEVDELPCALNDGATFGRPGDQDAAAAAELEQSLVAEHAERAQHGVGVDPEHGGEVLGGWEALSWLCLPIGNGGRNFAPAWSPDGQQIAFERRLGRKKYGPCNDCGRASTFEIWVMNADGSGQQRLTTRGAQPGWSPDGQKIAFMRERDGNPEIYSMNADGGQQRNLTRTRGPKESGLVWSPATKP